MRTVMVVVLVAAALWAGYWVAGSQLMQREVAAWFSAPPTGLTVSQSDISVTGFPNRFDLTVTNPAITAPDRGWGWSAPFAQAFMMTWKPWHVIAALPQEQTIDTPLGPFRLTSTQLKGSVVLVPGTALTLDRTVLSGDGLSLLRGDGWAVAVGKATFATRRMADDPNAHEVGFDASTLTPNAAFRLALQGRSDLPEQIDQLHIDTVLTLTAPIDRFAAVSRPRIAALRVKEGFLRWGDMQVSAKGEITPDAEGTAQGRIELRVENWRRLVPVLVAAGLVKPEVAPTVTRALELLAEQGDDPDALTVPLAFQSGLMSLGPLPLGPAPKLL